MCHNYLCHRADIERALIHELIHAYDHCRASDMEWGDCRHHACSEVREKEDGETLVNRVKC